MHPDHWLAKHFNEHRPRPQAIAHRMLESDSDADDAVPCRRHGYD